MNIEENKKFYEECIKRQYAKNVALAILTSATDYPTTSYLEALDDWVLGKITLEELDRNVDLVLYLED